MTLSITFPGAVTDHNGTLEGNTVTWDLIAPPENLHAEGGAVAGSSIPGWLMIIIAVVVFLGIVLVVGILAFRSRAKTLAKAEDAPVIEPIDGEQALPVAATVEPTEFVPYEPATPEAVAPEAADPEGAEPEAQEPEQK